MNIPTNRGSGNPKTRHACSLYISSNVDWVTVRYDQPTTFKFPPTVELPTYTIPMSEFMFPSTIAPDSSNIIVPSNLTFPATMVAKSRPRTPSFLMSSLTVVPYRPRLPQMLLLCRLLRPAEAPIRSIGITNNRRMCTPLKILNILNIWPNWPYHFFHGGYCHPSYGPSNGFRSWPRSLATGRSGSARGVADLIAARSVDLIFLTTILCPPYNPAICMLSH